MAKRVELDISRCCACGACSIACMDQNDIDLKTGVRPYRTVFRQEFNLGKSIEYYSISCMHCENAPCMRVCPLKVFERTENGFVVAVHQRRCIGCKKCLKVCPHDVPRFNKDGKIVKCDGCYARVAMGLEPACVRACNTGALSLEE